MQTHESLEVAITDRSTVGHARRQAEHLAQTLGLSEELRGRLALVVTEAATNICLHAGSGEILLRALPERTGVEVLALDKGPGMANLAACLRDGFSTAGSSGGGLGGMYRLSDSFDLHSMPGRGTALLARLGLPARSSSRQAPHEIGVVCTALPTESVSGDAWMTRTYSERSLIAVIDGLGHGALAAEASLSAVSLLEKREAPSPLEWLKLLHEGLRSGRGAAASIAEIAWSAHEIHFAGLGNVGGMVLSDSFTKNLTTYNGTLGGSAGASFPRVHEVTYPWPSGALLVLHSDGLLSRWSLDAYPGLLLRDPSLIAGILYRDFKRGRDDCTVLVVKQRKEAAA